MSEKKDDPLFDLYDREKELQRVFETIWMPAEIKHNPWEDH